jgi:threonine aldolase
VPGGRRLSLDPTPHPATVLRSLADYAGEVASDHYMTGELFDRLEGRVAQMLGKEAAVYLPSGKLAQMAALKTLTGRAGCRRVAMHPRCHLEEYEARAYQELWGMTAAHLGGFDRLATAADLAMIKEPLGAVALELPQRRLGCLLPSWQDLCALVEIARARGIALHLDGARLWESGPFYARPLHEIAGLFDTVYVAFDKGLGALSGAALAGPQDILDEVRVWQRRAGGRALRSFPAVLSALQALDERLGRMSAFHDKARELAAALSRIEGAAVSPNPPHANAFLVTLPGDPAKALCARDVVDRELGVWLFDAPVACVDQGFARFEVTVRTAAFGLSVEEVVRAAQRFSEMVCR